MKFVIFNCTLFVLSTLLFGQKLDVTLKIEKNEFVQYEPINIWTSIKNIGNDTVTICNFDYDSEDLAINIYDQNNIEVYPFETNEIDDIMPKYYDLMPGEEISRETDLLYYGSKCDFENKITRFGCYFEPGTYTILIKYYFHKNGNNMVMTFTSNSQIIKIDAPNEQDSLGILKDLKELARLHNPKENKLAECTQKAIDIINTYPQNPLVKQAYLYLNLRNLKYYNFNRDDYMKKFCLTFPNSFRAISLATAFITVDLAFKEKIEGTELYKNAIKFKRIKDSMNEMLKRNKSNSRLLKLMEKAKNKK